MECKTFFVAPAPVARGPFVASLLGRAHTFPVTAIIPSVGVAVEMTVTALGHTRKSGAGVCSLLWVRQLEDGEASDIAETESEQVDMVQREIPPQK